MVKLCTLYEVLPARTTINHQLNNLVKWPSGYGASFRLVTVVPRLYQQRLLVRKSVGSNPTLINIFTCFCLVVLKNKGGASNFEQLQTNTNDFEQLRMTEKDCEWGLNDYE